jgi:hypothetical protein
MGVPDVLKATTGIIDADSDLVFRGLLTKTPTFPS